MDEDRRGAMSILRVLQREGASGRLIEEMAATGDLVWLDAGEGVVARGSLVRETVVGVIGHVLVADGSGARVMRAPWALTGPDGDSEVWTCTVRALEPVEVWVADRRAAASSLFPRHWLVRPHERPSEFVCD